MIKTKYDLKKYLERDFNRYPKQKIPQIIRWLIRDEQTRIMHYLWVFRHTEYYKNINSPLFYFWYFWFCRLSNKLRVYLNLNSIGPGLRIVHIGGGVYLNANIIGENFTTTTGVVIGKNKSNINRPSIGDNVEFTIGAKAYGNIYIGDNVIVAPNSVVIKSVENNCIVSGVPGIIIKRNI